MFIIVMNAMQQGMSHWVLVVYRHLLATLAIAPLLLFLQCNKVLLKRHGWHKKLLKTRDPIIASIGWRCYQTTPVYAIEDQNGHHRMLKYTREHMHCLAMFRGPLAPPKTGVVAVQNLANSQVGDLLGTLIKLFKVSFLPFFEDLSPHLTPMLGKDKTDEERRVAICIFDDIAEEYREAALK